MLLLPPEIEVEGIRLHTNALLRMRDEPMDGLSRRTLHCFPGGTLSSERLVWAKTRTLREAARRADWYQAAEKAMTARLPEGPARAVLRLLMREIRCREVCWLADF